MTDNIADNSKNVIYNTLVTDTPTDTLSNVSSVFLYINAIDSGGIELMDRASNGRYLLFKMLIDALDIAQAQTLALEKFKREHSLEVTTQEDGEPGKH